MREKLEIGRFTLNYEDIAKNNICQIIIGKPKKYRIKAYWDEDFNRAYKIYKEKGVSIIEKFCWIPNLMDSIELPERLPAYISELLYDLYNFEFPNNGEKKDIMEEIYFELYGHLSNVVQGLLIKVKMESFMSEKLDFIGPAGIFCTCANMDKKDNFVTKLFRIHNDSISYDTGLIDETCTLPENSIGSINGGSCIYKRIEHSELLMKTLIK